MMYLNDPVQVRWLGNSIRAWETDLTSSIFRCFRRELLEGCETATRCLRAFLMTDGALRPQALAHFCCLGEATIGSAVGLFDRAPARDPRRIASQVCYCHGELLCA